MPLLLVPFLLALDQVLKIMAEQALAAGPRVAIPGFLDFTLVYNTGAAFGLFAGGAAWLSLINVAVGFALLYYMANYKLPRLNQAAYSLIVAGAWGNAIDRIGRGSVVDYMDLTTNIDLIRNFAVFNLADACVVVGVALLFIPQRKRR